MRAPTLTEEAVKCRRCFYIAAGIGNIKETQGQTEKLCVLSSWTSPILQQHCLKNYHPLFFR